MSDLQQDDGGIKRSPRGGRKHQPGRGHDRKSLPQKNELDILAILYHDRGDVAKAIAILRQSKHSAEGQELSSKVDNS
jgi:hypothetical protein